MADLLLGIKTEDEIVDIQPMNITPKVKVAAEEVKGQEGERPKVIVTSPDDNPKVEVDDGFAGF